MKFDLICYILIGLTLCAILYSTRMTITFGSKEKKVVPYVDLPADFWTPEDRASWLHFRGSPAGRKLGIILNNQVTSSAVTATADKDHSAHSCGRACGVRDTIQVLDMLLPEQISPAGAQSSNLDGSASQDAADSFAHLAP